MQQSNAKLFWIARNQHYGKLIDLNTCFLASQNAAYAAVDILRSIAPIMVVQPLKTKVKPSAPTVEQLVKRY